MEELSAEATRVQCGPPSGCRLSAEAKRSTVWGDPRPVGVCEPFLTHTNVGEKVPPGRSSVRGLEVEEMQR